MAIEQISVFLENQPGKLMEVLGFLAQQGFDLRAYTVAETPDFGILRMIVRDTAVVLAALKQHGFTAKKTQVLAVSIADEPGSSVRMLQLLHGAGINIEYTYAFALQQAQRAVMLLRVDDNAKAESILEQAGVVLAGEQSLF